MREAMRQRDAYVRGIVALGWPVPEPGRDRLLLAIGHALDFWAWLSLAELGLPDDEAAGLMSDMVRGVVTALRTPAQAPGLRRVVRMPGVTDRGTQR
jgi:hypothetical protein